jgi:hypothetical protein
MKNKNFEITQTLETKDSFILSVLYSENAQQADIIFNKKSLNLTQIKIFEMDEPSITINFHQPIKVKKFKPELFEVRAPEIFGKPKHYNKQDIKNSYESE